MLVIIYYIKYDRIFSTITGFIPIFSFFYTAIPCLLRQKKHREGIHDAFLIIMSRQSAWFFWYDSWFILRGGLLRIAESYHRENIIIGLI